MPATLGQLVCLPRVDGLAGGDGGGSAGRRRPLHGHDRRAGPGGCGELKCVQNLIEAIDHVFDAVVVAFGSRGEPREPAGEDEG